MPERDFKISMADLGSAEPNMEPRSRELLDMWQRLKPSGSMAEASRIALMMAGRVEPELADAVAKLALWRATQHPNDELLPRHLRDALAYSAFLDLILITDLRGMAQPQDIPEACPPKTG